MEIREWVRAARLHAKLTQTQLGEALGVTKGNVSAWETGRHEPSYGNLLKIAEVTRFGTPLPGLQFDANVKAARIGGRKVPLLNYVQAGAMTDVGANFGPDDVEFLATDMALSARSFALEIKGDSMTAAPGVPGDSFHPGDRIIVDCEVAPKPGDYVVAKNTGNEATFKKYKLVKIDELGNEIFELVPLNPDYPTLRSDEVHLEIIGTMVEWRRPFRR